MKSTRSCCSVQSSDVADLILTGLPAPVSRRPSSASPAKLMARSVSVAADSKAKRNAPEDAGSRAMNNLRRSNSTTQVNQRVNSSHSSEQSGDFLAFFESDPGGRKKLAALSKTSPEKKTTWNILDDQPRAFPGPSGSSLEPPAGLRRKEATVLLAANFTANNRSNKGAMGNCVTTMVHNNYSTAEKGPAPKSSNQAPSSLNNVVKATSNEDGEGSSSFVKSQKNFSSNNIMTRNNNSSSSSSSVARRREVTEEEAERFIQQVNMAAVTIQRWYRRHSQRHRTAAAALGRLMAAKREERQQRLEEGNILDLQERKDEERRKIREEKARPARRGTSMVPLSLQELHQKRAQKALEMKHSAEELVLVKESRRVPKKKPGAKPTSARNVSPAGSLTKANNAEANSPSAAAEPEGSGLAALGSVPSQDPGAEDKLQDVSSREAANEDLETAVTAGSRAPSKVTLNELLDTLRLLEEEPELLPPPKLLKKDRYAWLDREPSSNSLTADNLEKFGKLNHSPGVPEDGALLSEAKLQSIISFLDEMEKSEQERPRSAASATQREGFLLEEELAHVEQVSAVATEVTSSMMRLKLEVEEKKRAISLLQTALTQQRELTDRHVKQTEKELGHQLRLQREQYEAAIQRHLAFIDQLLDDKKVLSEKCEAVVAELKQVDHKYGQKITQMQEQHELEIKKLKELMSATEKVRREKWIEEKTKKIKEITVKGLEPEIQKLMAKHREDIRQLKLLHEAELLQSDERAAQHYGRQAQELRGLLEREKEEQSQRERERAWQRCEQQLEQEEQALELQRRRLYAEVAEEKERLSQQAARQRAEAEELRRQLEANSSALTRALRDEYTKEKEEQERRHQAELKVLKDQLELEKQAWEANYVKKEVMARAVLQREREWREEMRKERDKEIELVIQRLEADTSLAKEECERAAENRIKRIRDKYEVELQELERSERKLQERCNELKGRLAELEGESVRLQGLLKHKEQEVEEIRKVSREQSQGPARPVPGWAAPAVPGHRGLTEVIRQEFADRLVGTEEENSRLKAEMAELRARQQLELDRLVREKDRELEEVHRRVKAAVLRKEESMSSLRRQYEAAVQRANLLESLLEQQRQ
ncbi:CP131 protein, partial [Myiagra hebetior]|nr:CP131 protein [Myiagra hebetior]